jgi:hypothetical protein
MKQTASLSLLCLCLQNSDSKNEDPEEIIKYCQKLQADWHAVARIADSHFVSPLLYHQLVLKGLLSLLPRDIQFLLAEVYKLNLLRNELIYNEINTIGALLNPAGIEPIFIKGSAALLMNLYDDPGLRVMNDVDFLVNKKELPMCMELMETAGYYSMEGVNLPADFYHQNPLVHDRHPIRFEIHERLSHNAILESETIIENSLPIKMDKGVVRVPSKTHFTIHNILHHQMFDRGLYTRRVPLYQLCDLYMILEARDTDISWQRVREFFSNNLLLNEYFSPLDLLRIYFNQPPPGKIPYMMQCRLKYRGFRYRYNQLANRYRLLPHIDF